MITNYWNNLNERERWIAVLGLLCISFYLFYLLLLAPLTNTVISKSKQLKDNVEVLAWMQQVRQQPVNQTAADSITNTKLLALMGKQLKSNSLRLFTYQLQQMASGDIQLSYDKVPFSQFLSWLWDLNKAYTLTLKQLSAERTDRPGLVKLMIVIAANN